MPEATRPAAPNPLLAALSGLLACLALAGIVALLVWTYPQQPADWYWFIGRVLVAIPLAILVAHAGAQGIALGRRKMPD
jgi:formate hydrogenlyase subunit 3/multisubunit Na+/H+ antiporter MnhD subunit